VSEFLLTQAVRAVTAQEAVAANRPAAA